MLTVYYIHNFTYEVHLEPRSCVLHAVVYNVPMCSGKLTQTIGRATGPIWSAIVSLFGTLSLQPCQRRPHVHPRHWNPHPQKCQETGGNGENSELSRWRWNFLFAMQGSRETWKHQAISPTKEIKGTNQPQRLSPSIPQPRMTHRSHVPRTSWASCNTVVQFHPCQWKRRKSTLDVMDGFTFCIQYIVGCVGILWPSRLQGICRLTS